MSLCFRGNLAYKRLQRSTGTNHPLFVAGTTYEACLGKGTKVVTKNQEKVKLEGCVVPAIVSFPGEDCAACADINLDARYKNVGGYEWEVTFDDNYNDGERITYPLGNRADPTTSGLIPVSYRCNPTKDQKFKDEYYAKVTKKHEKAAKKRATTSTSAANHPQCGMILEGGSPCTKSVRADGLMCLICMQVLRKFQIVCSKKNLCTFYDRPPMEEEDNGEQESTFTHFIYQNYQCPYPLHLLIKDEVPIERANKLLKKMSDSRSMRSGLDAKFRAAVNEDMASAMMAACLASASAQSNRRASDTLFKYIPSLLKGIRDFSKVKGNPFSFLFHWSLLDVDNWVEAPNKEIELMPSFDFSDELRVLVDHGGHVSSKTYTTANPLTAGWYQGHWPVNKRAVRNNGGPEGFKLWLCIIGLTNPGYWGSNQVVIDNGVVSPLCELLCSKTGNLRPDAVAEVTFGPNDGTVLSCSDIISTKFVRIGGDMRTPVDIPVDDDSIVANEYGIFPRSTFNADVMKAQVKKAAESSSTATSAKKASAPSKKSAKKSFGKGSSNSILSHLSSSTKKQSSEVAAAKSNSSINRGTSSAKAASSTSLTSYLVASSKSKSHKQRPMAAAKSMLSNNKKRSNDDSDDSDIEIVSSNKASSSRAAKKSKTKPLFDDSSDSDDGESEDYGYDDESGCEDDDGKEVTSGWQGSSCRGKGLSVKIDDSFLNPVQVEALEDKVATAPSLLLADKLSDADIIICANKAAADNMARYSKLPIVKEKWLEHPDREHITQYAFIIDLCDSD